MNTDTCLFLVRLWVPDTPINQDPNQRGFTYGVNLSELKYDKHPYLDIVSARNYGTIEIVPFVITETNHQYPSSARPDRCIEISKCIVY